MVRVGTSRELPLISAEKFITGVAGDAATGWTSRTSAGCPDSLHWEVLAATGGAGDAKYWSLHLPGALAVNVSVWVTILHHVGNSISLNLVQFYKS
jgi:hypothetical protein